MTTRANPCGAATTWVVSANTWHVTCFGFLGDLLVFLYSWDRAAPSPADRFWRSARHMVYLRARMCLLGSRCCHSPFMGSNPPKTLIWGGVVNRLFTGLTCKILKPAYYRNYCIDSNQILHNIIDHKVLIVGGPNTAPRNPRWRTAAILKKNVKSPYLRNRVTNFHKIWQGHANWTLRPLKFRIFENPRWRRPPSWKSQKSRYYSSGNLARLCKISLLSVQTVKKFNFQNPRCRTAAILKTVKQPYLCNSLTDFDEIMWHGDANWCLAADRPLKFQFLKV